MIYRIEVEGKEYNDNYTFETPKEGVFWMSWRRFQKKWKLEELIS